MLPAILSRLPQAAEAGGLSKQFANISQKEKENREVGNQNWKKLSSTLAVLAMGCFAGVVSAQDSSKVVISTGNTDGQVGALSAPAGTNLLETETADDFDLGKVTVISGASIVGVIPAGTPLANIKNVEVEIYNVFPLDSATPSGNVPTRKNSPADHEIASATRDASNQTLVFRKSLLESNLTVQNSVVSGINKMINGDPTTTITHGEGPETGQEVRIDIVFTNPILLPAGHYFFRPEVQVTDGRFLFASAPKPIVAPGTPIPGDLQAWIRNSALAPDWLRVGTDIIAGVPPVPPTFNMTFTLTGNAILAPGTPGEPNCHGQTISGLAHEFGGIDTAAATLGYPSVDSLQQTVGAFCAP